MKKNTLVAIASLIALPFAAVAQTATTTGVINVARQAGDREFTLGGSGASNTDFDSSLGGVNFSYGQYINETLMWSLRQTVNYINPDVGGTQWNGSTRLAIDQHLTAYGQFRPFVGANFGGAYGDSVSDTWLAGLEIGGKYYVQPNTFVFAMAEYGWFFSDADRVEDEFNNGQFTWVVGVGFNF